MMSSAGKPTWLTKYRNFFYKFRYVFRKYPLDHFRQKAITITAAPYRLINLA